MRKEISVAYIKTLIEFLKTSVSIASQAENRTRTGDIIVVTQFRLGCGCRRMVSNPEDHHGRLHRHEKASSDQL